MSGLFIISDDPRIIHVADLLRTLQLILGCVVAAVAWRSLRDTPQDTLTWVYAGYRRRVWALVIGSMYVCLNAYSRLGQPVNLLLPVGLLFLVITITAMHHAVSAPRPEHDGARRLADYEPPRATEDRPK